MVEQFLAQLLLNIIDSELFIVRDGAPYIMSFDGVISWRKESGSVEFVESRD
jgi:hypothetical protein